MTRTTGLRASFLTATALSAVAFTTMLLRAEAQEASQPQQQPVLLDTVVFTVLKVVEKAIDALAGVSVVNNTRLDEIQATRTGDIFRGVPGVWTQQNVDDPAVGFNVRGLQDVGRVAVVIDGARQNFQVSQHGPNGKVYVEPEMLAGAEVVKGPVSNVYGSGAIGGVVALSTRNTDDILRPGERYAVEGHGLAGSNGGPYLGSIFAAARPNETYDIVVGGVLRKQDDFRDGNGDTVVNSGQSTGSGMAKVNIHPGNGHELTFGFNGLHSTFDSGVPENPADPTDGGTHYGNVVNSYNGTAEYRFKRPDMPLVDFKSTAYWSHTDQTTTVKEQYAYCDPQTNGFPNYAPPCTDTDSSGTTDVLRDFTGPVGTWSKYAIDTLGFDVHNTSRFDAFNWKHTVTFGGDFFDDHVSSTSSSSAPDAGNLLTPSAERQAYGAFVQWLAERGTWLDIIGAVRYDGFQMEGGGSSSSGDRLSPKLTVAITPTDGVTFYGTYAEGYRAPHVSEAYVSGQHPGAIFRFLPNPSLRPEIGKTVEVGVNFRKDNVFRDGDTFRMKLNGFENDVTDYIDLNYVFSPGPPDFCSFGSFGPQCYNYVNIASAHLQGVELEASYDAGRWFTQFSGHHIRGINVDTGDRLSSVPPAQVMWTVGMRFLDDRLTIAPYWQHVWSATLITSTDNITYAPYDLFGLNVTYKATENMTAALIVDNIFDTNYLPYLQNRNSPGLNVKGSLKVRFAAK